jgi:small subunit ribosomal protein S21
MIVIPIKEGENIERALKKFKRKFEKTGVVKELRRDKHSLNLRLPKGSRSFVRFTFRNFKGRRIGLHGCAGDKNILHMLYKENYLSYLRFEKRYSIHTVEAYEKDIIQFYEFCSVNGFSDDCS